MHTQHKIKALLFLGIFGLLLLHNLVPHTHHHHEVEHLHNGVAHSGGHNHNHDIPEKENSTNGLLVLLDLFLEVHEHSVASSETVVVHNRTVIKLNVKKDISTSVSINHFHNSTNNDESEKVTVYHPPITYFNFYLSSLDSRGPPTLG
jgi:hypothetical protein